MTKPRIQRWTSFFTEPCIDKPHDTVSKLIKSTQDFNVITDDIFINDCQSLTESPAA